MEKKVHLNFSFINSRAFLIVFGFIFQISDFDGKINLVCALHHKSFGIFESKYKAVFFFNHIFMAFNHGTNLIIVSMNNFTAGILKSSNNLKLLFQVVNNNKYRISEWAEFQVWKFLYPKG